MNQSSNIQAAIKQHPSNDQSINHKINQSPNQSPNQ